MELTREQKVKIINRAKKLLGPNGENWVKGMWFGRRSPNGVLTADVEQPNSWCVLGALGEASFQLGYTDNRRFASSLGSLIGIDETLAKGRTWAPTVPNYNDAGSTTFAHIKRLLNKRLAELRKEKNAEQTSKIPPC